jgi:hypothetical protein
MQVGRLYDEGDTKGALEASNRSVYYSSLTFVAATFFYIGVVIVGLLVIFFVAFRLIDDSRGF